MPEDADWVVRLDLPACGDGYDRAAVDAHLQRIAARVGDRADLPVARPAADDGLLSAGRLLLEQISALRLTIDRLATALGEQSEAVAGVLDELIGLQADATEPGPTGAAESPASAEPPTPTSEPAVSPADVAEDRHDAGARRTAEATLADARLVALDMALGGGTPAEIERELRARFELTDPAGLTDEVLAALG